MNNSFSSPSREILDLLEYRIRSVAIGHLALRHWLVWDEIPDIKIFFNDQQVIEGKATVFTNSAIESAIIYSRALLEFLGLKKNKDHFLLRELDQNRQKGDIGIEQFKTLNRITIKNAVSAYSGDPKEAEAALAYVIHLANKDLAHTTMSILKHDQGAQFLDITFRAIPILMINHFYIPLSLNPPDFALPFRHRD